MDFLSTEFICRRTALVSGGGADREPAWSEFYLGAEVSKSRPNPYRPLDAVLGVFRGGPTADARIQIIEELLQSTISCLTSWHL